MQAAAIASGCPPELDDNTLLHRLKLQNMEKSSKNWPGNFSLASSFRVL